MPIAVNFLLSLLLVWMQTSFEEIVFRGLFLRGACGDKIRPSAACVVMGVVFSLLFMSMHLSNAEVLRQSGFQIVLCALSYFVVAGMAYTLNVVFGSLMPGLVLHWSNNFLIFTLTTAADGTNPTPALFLAESGGSGWEFLTAELPAPDDLSDFLHREKGSEERSGILK